VATTSPARIDDQLYASAKLAGEAQSRSAAQQVVHWARIGRAIEASEGVSLRDVGAVLAGAGRYDELTAWEQAVVRAEWSARMDELREGLDLAEAFRSEGRSWVELDDDGAVVRQEAGGGRGAPAKRTPAKVGRNTKVVRAASVATPRPRTGKRTTS
jgi:hypothetical protein